MLTTFFCYLLWNDSEIFFSRLFIFVPDPDDDNFWFLKKRKMDTLRSWFGRDVPCLHGVFWLTQTLVDTKLGVCVDVTDHHVQDRETEDLGIVFSNCVFGLLTLSPSIRHYTSGYVSIRLCLVFVNHTLGLLGHSFCTSSGVSIYTSRIHWVVRGDWNT